MEKMMYVVEESSCLMRCCLTILGGLNLRCVIWSACPGRPFHRISK